MKVIVAGFSKTGTKSMNQALTRLGYKVYDVFENMYILGEDFANLLSEGWSTEDFRRMYDDVDAVVDFPANFFWDEIHKAFPDAKIILTIRNNEDEWVKSMARQYEMDDKNFALKLMFNCSFPQRRTNKYLKDLFLKVYGVPASGALFRRMKADDLNQDMMKLMYRAHNAYLQHAAPKEKLLVYNCKEGWGPLCNFLGVPVPDEAFPHVNKKGAISKELENHPIVKKMFMQAILSVIVVATATFSAGAVVYKYGGTWILNGSRTLVGTILDTLHMTQT